MVHANAETDGPQNGQLGSVLKPRGWRWAKAKMYRELRAEGKAEEARKIFRESEHWRRHFDTVVTDSSGNVFADLGLSEPALRLENARLRARVIDLEDRRDLAESYPLGTAKEPK